MNRLKSTIVFFFRSLVLLATDLFYWYFLMWGWRKRFDALQRRIGEVYAGSWAIVTGGSGGIGREICNVLAKGGVNVIIAARSSAQGHEAKNLIYTAIKERGVAVQVVYMRLDLGDVESVKKFANEILQRKIPVRLLINNAAVMGCDFESSPQGFEKQFAVNHIGHAALTELLMPVLISNAPSRIINVTSAGYFLGSVTEDLFVQTKPSSFDKFMRYFDTKAANIIYTQYLRRRFAEQGAKDVSAIAFHPGSVATNISAKSDIPLGASPLKMRVLMTPEMGAYFAANAIMWPVDNLDKEVYLYLDRQASLPVRFRDDVMITRFSHWTHQALKRCGVE